MPKLRRGKSGCSCARQASSYSHLLLSWYSTYSKGGREERCLLSSFLLLIRVQGPAVTGKEPHREESSLHALTFAHFFFFLCHILLLFLSFFPWVPLRAITSPFHAASKVHKYLYEYEYARMCAAYVYIRTCLSNSRFAWHIYLPS